jgi:hypothetical protein
MCTYIQELQILVRQLVANIHSLFSTLGVKEDIWSVGPFARVSSQRRDFVSGAFICQ